MTTEEAAPADFSQMPFAYTLSIVGGKWKMPIIYLLAKKGTVRFNEMSRMLGKITDRTLSAQLKELEADGMIVRRAYPQIPPKVEYSLSERGKSIMPALDGLCNWGVAHAGDEVR